MSVPNQCPSFMRSFFIVRPVGSLVLGHVVAAHESGHT